MKKKIQNYNMQNRKRTRIIALFHIHIYMIHIYIYIGHVSREYLRILNPRGLQR